MAFFLEELKITGLDLLQIRSCEIYGGVGQHHVLELTAYVEHADEVLYHRGIDQILHLYFEKRGRDQKWPLFAGLVTKVGMVCEGELTVLTLQAKSLTYLLDIKKKSRSFQDVRMTYGQVVKTVLADYEMADAQICFEDQEIGTWLVQYEETDWEFLNRILSRLSIALTPIGYLETPAVYAGIPEPEPESMAYELLAMEKDLYSWNSRLDQDLNADDYISYQIQSMVMKQLCQTVEIAGVVYLISQCRYHFSGGRLAGSYRLQRKEALGIPPRYPVHMIGLALTGSIASAREDQVLVDLDIDREQPGEPAFWLPYATVSAAADGSGWYFMPEKGDRVKVYFPTRELSQAIVLNTVNDYQKPQSGADLMGNERRVYLSTVHNKKLILDDGEIKIASEDEGVWVALQKDGTVTFHAANLLEVAAASEIQITGGQRVELEGQTQAGVTDTYAAASIVVNKDGGILLTGENIGLD